jgi:hypothetical protein
MNGFVIKNSLRSRRVKGFPRFIIFAIIAGFFPLSGFAVTEVSTSALGLGLGGSESHLGLGLGYQKEFLTWLQLGGSGELEKLSHGEGTTSVTVWRVRVGPTLNMDGAIPQAYFFSTGFAMRHGNGTVSSTSDDPNASGAYVQFGKRFPIGLVSYRPNVSVILAGGMNIRIELLSFSAFF